MTTRRHSLLLACKASWLVLAGAAVAADAQRVPPVRVFDPRVFEAQIRGELADGENSVVGYQVAVVQGGRIVADFAGGKADLEAGRNMTTRHLLNIGSTVKFVTGTLFLRLVEQKAATAADPAARRQQLLDSKVWDHFPAAFRRSAHWSVAHLTFRDLLAHRSNFVKGSHQPWKHLPNGIQTRNRDLRVPTYQNANFALLGYLIPLFDRPSRTNTVDAVCRNDVRCAARMLGALYEQVVREKLRQAIEPALPGTCRGRLPTLQTWVAKNYFSPSVPRRGARHDSYRGIGHCHGDGGWLYSARGLARLLIHLENDPGFIDPAFYDSWVDPRSRTGEWLAWFWTTPSRYFRRRLGWTGLPTQRGDHGFPNDRGQDVRAHSAVVMLPYDFYAIAIVNSTNDKDSLDSRTLAAILERQFVATFDPRTGG